MMIKKYLRLFSILMIILSMGSLSLSCSSGENNSKEDKAMEKKEDLKLNNSLPPGNADVIAYVKNSKVEGNEIKIVINIKEVSGYGPSTPQLPTGADVDLYVSKKIIKDEQNMFEAGKTLSMRIQIQQRMNDSDKWVFKFFNKK